MVGRAIKARGQVTLTKLYDGTNGTDGKNGSDGAVGAPGADGKTTYVHVAYSSSADGKTNFSITDPSGRSYIGVLTDFTEKDSTDYTQYSWSLVKGQDGQNGEDGAPGAPGEDGKTTYIHIAYANSADGQTDFSTTENSGKKYIGVLTDEVEKDSTDYTQYSWSLFKGQDGADGTPGKPGADGKTPYVHFAYANSADGNTDFSTTVYSNKKYIGTLTDYTIPDSTDYTKYTWTLIKGADGADGTPGKPGSDGKTPYIHFAYANSADGKTDFSVTDYSNKKFIGTLTDYVIPDSTDYTKYTWSRLKGESGVGIANTVVEYQVTDTQDQPSEDSGWTSSIPNLGTGSYLWTRTTFFYTDGTTSRAYTISKQSDNTYTAVLTNDSITLPSDSNGKVTDFSNSTGNFLVYDGTYQVDSTTIKVQLVQAVNVTVTLGGNAYTITAMDSTKDTGYFDLSYTYKGVALTKRVSVSKSKSGANGTTPIIVNLSANAQVFTFDSNNHANPTSQNILFKTTVSGTTATPVYKAIPYDESGNTGAEIVMSNSGTNGKMLQVSQLKDYVSILVTASIGSVSDSTTIVRVKDGSSISPIPDPSNTVSSNTPPTDAKDGDWWNDTSQTPNVLKYRYRDKWVQYELDGYYVKANSISGEAIVTNTLEAQKIKYTNSNGTTTNLQTFDFSGMKTLLTDTKGNTYDSMESAVGSTKVMSSLQKKVNDLGQVNQLFNTEFSPDFAGWSSSSLSNYLNYIDIKGVYNRSHVLHYNGGTTSRLDIQSQKIKIENPTQTFSISVLVKGTVGLSVVGYKSDSDVEFSSWYTATSANTSYSDWTLLTFNNKSIISGSTTAITSIAFNITSVGTEFWLSEPMLVFSSSVGDYVPGQYNNNERVLKIEESADKFQIRIGESVVKAQNSADSAKTKIDNLSVGGRNLLLNSTFTSGFTSWNNENSSWTVDSGTYDGKPIIKSPTTGGGGSRLIQTIKTPISVGDKLTVSFNAKGTMTGDKVFITLYNLATVNSANISLTTDMARYSFTMTVPTNFSLQNIYFWNNTAGNSIYINEIKLETGNTPTAWSPAPEDVQAGIDTAQSGVNTISQVNLINNSDFSPDLAGWTSRGAGNFTTGDYDYSGGVYIVESTSGFSRTSSAPIPLNSPTGKLAYSLSFNSYIFNLPSGGRVTAQLTFLDSNLNEISSSFPGFTELTSNGTGKWVNTMLNNITFTPPIGAVYVVFSFDSRGIGTKAGFNRPILVKGASVGSYVRGDYGMSTATVLKLTADNYSMGIDANGNLVSGISGNKQQVTLKGNVIHLDGNTNVTGDFYAKGGNFTNINIANVSGTNPSLIKSNFESAYGNVSITPTDITLQSYNGTSLMTELAIGSMGISIKMPGIPSFLDSTIINANGMSFQHGGGSYATVGVMDAGFTLEHNVYGGSPMSIRIGDGGTPNGGKNSANDMAFAISAAQDNGTAPQLIWAGSRVGKITTTYRTWNNPQGFILADSIKFSTWDDTASRVEIDDTVNFYNYAPVQVYGQRFTDGTTRTLHLSGKEVSSGAKWFGFLDGGDQAGFGTDNTNDVIFFMKGKTYSLYTMLGKLGMR